MNRRDFFGGFALGMGGMALFGLAEPRCASAAPTRPRIRSRAFSPQPHFAPKAKRIIYLFMSGGPSQHRLFDYKPLLNQTNGEDLPESVRMGQRLTGMSAQPGAAAAGGIDFQVRAARPERRVGERIAAVDGEDGG